MDGDAPGVRESVSTVIHLLPSEVLFSRHVSSAVKNMLSLSSAAFLKHLNVLILLIVL